MVLKGASALICTRDTLTGGYLSDRRNIVPDECSERQEGMKGNRNNH